MVESTPSQMNSVFRALGDPTRRRMLHDLSRGERTVGQLAAPFSMSLAAASKHVRTLENAGLLRREVRGRTHWCHFDPTPLAEAYDWLGFYRRFWSRSLDRLEDLLREADARTPAESKDAANADDPENPEESDDA